ncbi:hypothetical protein EWS92_22435 [Vibrio vulnificus]|uniref:hypothetical protein n=1 Tax=Vibrio TaxID=662 RepID=UPI0018DD40F8|nr:MULTISPECIES: hypothetical protein [Vibrio]EJG0984942.1 hypothetical protein [Vibrio parahaemolyticus]ELB2789004.1 hypothetical protein [Vibrio alginolyticus]EGR0790352.1 hypothetical protein [Vibrio vulnificus]EGR0799742.1 hypothetical protein [Vibrio vulnificus]EGR0817127.1 hypothetical protein [Vibrio vulnificus]
MGNNLSKILIMFMTITAMTFAIYEQSSSLFGFKFGVDSELVKLRQLQSTFELELLQNQLKELVDEKIASVPSSEKTEFVVINQKLTNLEAKIKNVSDQTIGLRQAINPTKPDEILKIARLTDEVRVLRSELTKVEKNVVAQQKAFQDSILRELKSSNDSTTLILVVLLPLVLNFLYTVWKDFKVSAQAKEQS